MCINSFETCFLVSIFKIYILIHPLFYTICAVASLISKRLLTKDCHLVVWILSFFRIYTIVVLPNTVRRSFIKVFCLIHVFYPNGVLFFHLYHHSYVNLLRATRSELERAHDRELFSTVIYRNFNNAIFLKQLIFREWVMERKMLVFAHIMDNREKPSLPGPTRPGSIWFGPHALDGLVLRKTMRNEDENMMKHGHLF